MMKHLQQSVLEGSAGPVLKAARRKVEEGEIAAFFLFFFFFLFLFAENDVKLLLAA